MQPQFFVRRGGASGHGAVGETHMNDIHLCGTPSELNEVRELLGERLDVKFGEVIQHSGRNEHLKRVRYRGDGVRFVRPSDAHTNNYLAALDIVGCKPCAVPYLQKGDDDSGAEPLPPEMASAYRTAMGIALYIAADRWDLQREVQRCTRILAALSSHDCGASSASASTCRVRARLAR